MEKRIINLKMSDLEDSGVHMLSLVDEPAIESYWVYLNKEIETKLAINDEKRIIVGPVIIPNFEIYRNPVAQVNGNEPFYIQFDIETIGSMAEKFMRQLKLNKTNLAHEDNSDAGSYIFESWIVETLEDKANTVYNLNVPIGTWVVKMKIENDETWNKVKSGELKGFSIEGSFVAENEIDEDELFHKELYDKIRNLLAD